jgi:V/A-type H+-transporting ATPase subunit D
VNALHGSALRLASTRLDLLRGRRRLERVAKGRELLHKKREALVRELLREVRPAADARADIAAQAAEAYRALLAALGAQGAEGLVALGWPERRLEVELEPTVVWGVAAPRLSTLPTVGRTLAARATTPGAGSAAVETADAFEALLERLLAAASRELLITRLAGALAAATRQVRSLEQRVAPRLSAELTRVARALDEREREERVRARHLVRRGAQRSRRPGGAAGPRAAR